MKTRDLGDKHIGRSVRIETKVKSKPITGVIKSIQVTGDVAYVTIQTAFGSKGHVLTPVNEFSLTD